MNRQVESARRKTTAVFRLPIPTKNTNVAAADPTLQAPQARTGGRLRKLVWLTAFLALLGTGVALRLQSASDSASATPSPDDSLREVRVTVPERAAGGGVTLPATIQAYQATDLYGRASGFLKAWHFDIGAAVKKGQILAEIDTPELDQELAQAAAQLIQGQADHQQAVAELEEAKADVALAEANVVKARANVDFSISQAVRYESLVRSRSVAREEHENVIRERDARKAELDSARADLARRKSNLVTRQAIIKSREAAVSNREANVRRLRDLTGFQKIAAPFDGVVTRRNAEVGMLVTAGSNTGTQPIYRVAQVDVLRVQASVPQSSALGIRPGDPVQVTIPERPGQSFKATVSRTTGAVEPASRALLVEVELPNRDSLLLPGVYAQVRFQTAQPGTALVIPAKALLMRSSGPHVVSVQSGGALRTQKVELGRDFGASVEVLVGLNGDERLVVNPSDDLRDGQEVRVADDTAPRVQLTRK